MISSMPPEEGRSVSYVFKAFFVVAFTFLAASGASLAVATLDPGNSGQEAQLAQAAASGDSKEKDAVKTEGDKSSDTTVAGSKTGKPAAKDTGECSPDELKKLKGKELKDRIKKCSTKKGKLTWKDQMGKEFTCIKGGEGENKCDNKLSEIAAAAKQGGVTFTPEGSNQPIVFKMPPPTSSDQPLDEQISQSIASAFDEKPTVLAQVASDKGDFEGAKAVLEGYANPVPTPNTNTEGARLVQLDPSLKNTYSMQVPQHQTPIQSMTSTAPPPNTYKAASTFGQNVQTQAPQGNTRWFDAITSPEKITPVPEYAKGLKGGWAPPPNANLATQLSPQQSLGTTPASAWFNNPLNPAASDAVPFSNGAELGAQQQFGKDFSQNTADTSNQPSWLSNFFGAYEQQANPDGTVTQTEPRFAGVEGFSDQFAQPLQNGSTAYIVGPDDPLRANVVQNANAIADTKMPIVVSLPDGNVAIFRGEDYEANTTGVVTVAGRGLTDIALTGRGPWNSLAGALGFGPEDPQPLDEKIANVLQGGRLNQNLAAYSFFGATNPETGNTLGLDIGNAIAGAVDNPSTLKWLEDNNVLTAQPFPHLDLRGNLLSETGQQYAVNARDAIPIYGKDASDPSPPARPIEVAVVSEPPEPPKEPEPQRPELPTAEWKPQEQPRRSPELGDLNPMSSAQAGERQVPEEYRPYMKTVCDDSGCRQIPAITVRPPRPEDATPPEIPGNPQQAPPQQPPQEPPQTPQESPPETPPAKVATDPASHQQPATEPNTKPATTPSGDDAAPTKDAKNDAPPQEPQTEGEQQLASNDVQNPSAPPTPTPNLFCAIFGCPPPAPPQEAQQQPSPAQAAQPPASQSAPTRVEPQNPNPIRPPAQIATLVLPLQKPSETEKPALVPSLLVWSPPVQPAQKAAAPPTRIAVAPAADSPGSPLSGGTQGGSAPQGQPSSKGPASGPAPRTVATDPPAGNVTAQVFTNPIPPVRTNANATEPATSEQNTTPANANPNAGGTAGDPNLRPGQPTGPQSPPTNPEKEQPRPVGPLLGSAPNVPEKSNPTTPNPSEVVTPPKTETVVNNSRPDGQGGGTGGSGQGSGTGTGEGQGSEAGVQTANTQTQKTPQESPWARFFRALPRYVATMFDTSAQAAPAPGPIEGNTITVPALTTFFGPGAGCTSKTARCRTGDPGVDKMQGGFDTTKPNNLNGQSTPMTLDCVRTGGCKYVTLASHPSNWGKYYLIGEITYKSPEDGKMYTLKNVVGFSHDGGAAFRDGECSRYNTCFNVRQKFDVAVGDFRGTTAAQAYKFLVSKGQEYGGNRFHTWQQLTQQQAIQITGTNPVVTSISVAAPDLVQNLPPAPPGGWRGTPTTPSDAVKRARMPGLAAIAPPSQQTGGQGKTETKDFKNGPDGGKVQLHLAPGFDSRKPFSVVYYFGGHRGSIKDANERQKLLDQIAASGRNVALVTPQFGSDGTGYGALASPEGMKKFMDEAAQELAKMSGGTAEQFKQAPRGAVAYSGGGSPLVNALPHVQSAQCLDCLYSDRQAKAVKEWLQNPNTKFEGQSIPGTSPDRFARDIRDSLTPAQRERAPITSSPGGGHENYVTRAATANPVEDFVRNTSPARPAPETDSATTPRGPHMVDPQTGTAFSCSENRAACETIFRQQAFLSRGCADGSVPCDAKIAPHTATPKGTAPRPLTRDEAMQKVRDYLFDVYNREPVKRDSSGDFSHKDPQAATRVGKSLKDYVIGGMSEELQLKLYAAGQKMDAEGIKWSMLSAFRDQYRQEIATGFKASACGSMHSGQNCGMGGYGKGVAIDVSSAQAADWLARNGSQYGLSRPMPGKDPYHIQTSGSSPVVQQTLTAVMSGGTPQPTYTIKNADGIVVADDAVLPQGTIAPNCTADCAVDLVVNADGTIFKNPKGDITPANDANLPIGKWNPQEPDKYEFADDRPEAPKPSSQRNPNNPWTGRSAGDPRDQNGPAYTGSPPPPPPPPQQQQPKPSQQPPPASPIRQPQQTPQPAAGQGVSPTPGTSPAPSVQTTTQPGSIGAPIYPTSIDPTLAPPTLSCSPQKIPVNTNLTVQWNCFAGNPISNFPTGGASRGTANLPMTRIGTSTPMIYCVVGTRQSAPTGCIVNIVPPKATSTPTATKAVVSLVANPQTVEPEGHARVSWTGLYIDRCNIYALGLLLAASSSSGSVRTPPLSRSTIVRAVCGTNGAITATSSVTVLVSGDKEPPQDTKVPDNPLAR